MATHRVRVRINRPDANVFEDLIANQITEQTSPSIGDLLAYFLADGGADEGVFVDFNVPQNYVGTPKIVVKGILDGAPSNGHDLGFGFRGLAVADNETADATFAAEDTVQNTDIGGTGSAYSDEDLYVTAIDITQFTPAAGEHVQGYFYIDASGTTYTGNFALISLEFQYADA